MGSRALKGYLDGASMTETARSRNGIPIRLPDERWIHLTEGHSEMAGYLLRCPGGREGPRCHIRRQFRRTPGRKDDAKR